MRYILSLFIFVITISLFSQENKTHQFYLLDKFNHADLNYNKMDSINFHSPGLTMLDSVFIIKPGKHTVYRFINKDKGMLYPGSGMRDLYFLIILKVDSQNTIIDGYYYHLTHAESGAICRLYQLTEHIKLKSEIRVEDLHFQKRKIMYNNEDICEYYPIELQDKGVITLKRKIKLKKPFQNEIIYNQYYLLDKNKKADINYAAIELACNAFIESNLLDSVFNPVAGDFNVYRFFYINKNEPFCDQEVCSFSFIIVKTDTKGNIIDGYYYWINRFRIKGQAPSINICALYRTTEQIRLKSDLGINKLKFKRVAAPCDNLSEYLYEEGFLRLKKKWLAQYSWIE